MDKLKISSNNKKKSKSKLTTRSPRSDNKEITLKKGNSCTEKGATVVPPLGMSLDGDDMSFKSTRPKERLNRKSGSKPSTEPPSTRMISSSLASPRTSYHGVKSIKNHAKTTVNMKKTNLATNKKYQVLHPSAKNSSPLKTTTKSSSSSSNTPHKPQSTITPVTQSSLGASEIDEITSEDTTEKAGADRGGGVQVVCVEEQSTQFAVDQLAESIGTEAPLNEMDDDITEGSKYNYKRVPMAPPLVLQLPHKETWPNSPVLIRWSTGAGPVNLSLATSTDNIPIDSLDALVINSFPINFETPLFKGQAMVRIAKVQGAKSGDTTLYFENRRRTLQICIQGKFKRRIAFDNVYSGQEFAQPLRQVPAKRLVKWAFSLLRSRLPDAFVADLFGPLPYFLAPLVLAAKVVRCDNDETCPNIRDHDILEDMSHHGVKSVKLDPILLNPEINPGHSHTARALKKHEIKIKKAQQKFASESMKQRKRDIGQPKSLSQNFYEPDKTYTFDYYDSFFCADSFCLDLGVKRLDLCPIVGDQPVVSSMAKTMDTGEYLWKFELWNQRAISDKGDLFRTVEEHEQGLTASKFLRAMVIGNRHYDQNK